MPPPGLGSLGLIGLLGLGLLRPLLIGLPPPLLPQEVQHKDRFEIKESVQAYLSAQVLADSPAPDRLL